jgi:hypothetical protein
MIYTCKHNSCRAVVEAIFVEKKLADERAILHMLRERERMWMSRSRGLLEQQTGSVGNTTNHKTVGNECHFAAVSVDVAMDTRGIYEQGWASQLASLQQQLAMQGKAIASTHLGAAHTVILCASGEVYAWGWGDRGQLGQGNLSRVLHQ